MSRRWDLGFRTLYRLLRFLDPAIRVVSATSGLGNVTEVRIRGRRSGRMRSTLLGLLHAGGHIYIGHPNGEASWARDLLVAREAELVGPGGERTLVRAEPLPPGRERQAAIEATWQHPFPGNVIYRLARRHILDRGVYFRLEPIGDGPGADRDG